MLIPVWNGTAWLDGAIASIRAQTNTDWELVIGDNASDDDPRPIVEAIADPRIRYQRWADHLGAFENFDRTFALARGDWAYLMPADDRLRPTCLERIAARIDAHRGSRPLAAVITAAARVDAEGRPFDVRYYGYEGPAQIADGTYDAAGWLRQMTKPGSQPWDCGAFSCRVVGEMGAFYRTDIPSMSADIELTLRVAAYGDVAYIDEPLIAVTAYSESHSQGRFGRNLASEEPFTTQGVALQEGLRAHTARRRVGDDERALVRAAVARTHLRRASAHRYRPWGRGRVAAARDIRRAMALSPGTVVPRRVPLVLGLLLAPRALVVAARELTLRQRARAARPPR